MKNPISNLLLLHHLSLHHEMGCSPCSPRSLAIVSLVGFVFVLISSSVIFGRSRPLDSHSEVIVPSGRPSAADTADGSERRQLSLFGNSFKALQSLFGKNDVEKVIPTAPTADIFSNPGVDDNVASSQTSKPNNGLSFFGSNAYSKKTNAEQLPGQPEPVRQYASQKSKAVEAQQKPMPSLTPPKVPKAPKRRAGSPPPDRSIPVPQEMGMYKADLEVNGRSSGRALSRRLQGVPDLFSTDLAHAWALRSFDRKGDDGMKNEDGSQRPGLKHRSNEHPSSQRQTSGQGSHRRTLLQVGSGRGQNQHASGNLDHSSHEPKSHSSTTTSTSDGNDEFTKLASRLPVVPRSPHVAVVWAGPEGHLHTAPWKFGHAEGGSAEKLRPCRGWFATEGACFAGMDCFWRDVVHPGLARRTTVSLESTWERGYCDAAIRESMSDSSSSSSGSSSRRGSAVASTSSYYTSDGDDEAFCFLLPRSGNGHTFTVPYPSAFAASSAEELTNHLQLLAWSGRRVSLATHVFPMGPDVPTRLQRHAAKQRTKATAAASSPSVATATATAAAVAPYRSTPVQQASRLRRALRSACRLHPSCRSLDSFYEDEDTASSLKREAVAAQKDLEASAEKGSVLFKQTASRARIANQMKPSPLEESLKPTTRRAVAQAFLASDFCLLPPLAPPAFGGPMRPALIDALLAGCIPVFFASCLDDRLAYETMLAPHFLPSHTRGNRTAALLANAAQELASASPESETTTTIVADRRGGGSSSNSWGGSSGGSSHNRRDNKPNTRRPSYRALQDLDHREDALQEENQKEDEDKRRTLLAPNQRHSDRSGGANNENRKNSRSNNNGKSGGRGDKSGRGGSANQQEASFKPRSFPWPVRGGATNDGFGVGLWAVLIDARALGLRDGDNWQYGVSAPSPTENDDNDNEDDGTLDEPAANRRREAAIARVLEYLATIPTEEKTRMRSEIIAAVPRLQYSYQASRFGGAAAARRQQRGEDEDSQRKGSSSSSALPESAERVTAAVLALRYQAHTCSQISCSSTKFQLGDFGEEGGGQDDDSTSHFQQGLSFQEEADEETPQELPLVEEGGVGAERDRAIGDEAEAGGASGSGNDQGHGGRGSGGGWVGQGNQGLAYTTTREGDSYQVNYGVQADSARTAASAVNNDNTQDPQRGRVLREKGMHYGQSASLSSPVSSFPPDFYQSSSSNMWKAADQDSWGEFPNRGFGDSSDQKAGTATAAAATTTSGNKGSKLGKGPKSTTAWQAASVPLDATEEAEEPDKAADASKEFPLVDIPSPDEGKSPAIKATTPHTCASKTAQPLSGRCDHQVRDGSWLAARDYCEAVGARLCSAHELERGLGWNTGCTSTAGRPAWTLTPCGDGGGLERASGSGGGGGGDNNKGRIGGFSGPGAAIGDGAGAFVLVNQGRLRAQKAAFDASRRSQQSGAYETSGFSNNGGNGGGAKLRWYEKMGSLHMSMKPPLSPSYLYTATANLDDKAHASPGGHRGGAATTGAGLRREWSRRLGLANNSSIAAQWYELGSGHNEHTWNENGVFFNNNYKTKFQNHRSLESISNNGDDSIDRLGDTLLYSDAPRSFGSPIGGGLQSGSALALGTLARDAGGSSSSSASSKHTISSGASYGEHATVAAAARAVEAATLAQARAKAKASAQAAMIARQRQGRRSHYYPSASGAGAGASSNSAASSLASVDPGLGQLATWEAGNVFSEGPFGADESPTTSKPRAGSAAALAAAHSAALAAKRLHHAPRGKEAAALAKASSHSSFATPLRPDAEAASIATHLCLPAYDLGYGASESKPPAPICCADFGSDGSSSGGHCAANLEANEASSGRGRGEKGASNGRSSANSGASMEQKAREAHDAAKRRDHVHIPGDKHDGGFGMAYRSSSNSSNGDIDSRDSSSTAQASRESGGSVSGSAAAAGVPSMAVGRVGGKPRLAVVLFGPTGRSLGNSSSKVLECTPRGKALQLMAAASQKEHFFDPLSRGEMPPAAVSRLRATHTVAGSLSTANVRSSSSSQHLYQQQHHHHRGGKNPSLIAAPARRTLQANSSSFPSSSDIHHHQEQHGERYSHGTSRFSRRQLAANNAASFDIDVYLASSPACGNDWEDTLKRAYAPYLKQVIFDDCSAFADKRCLLNRGLDLVEQSFEPYLFVVLARPDTAFKVNRGRILATELVSAPDRLTFPFACSNHEWDSWSCAADTLIAVPGHRVNSFRQTCVGYRAGPASCFASASSAALFSSSSSKWTSSSPKDMRRLSVEEEEEYNAGLVLIEAEGERRLQNSTTTISTVDTARQQKVRHHGGPSGIKSIEGRGRVRKPRDTHELFDLTSSTADSDRSSSGGGFIRAQDRRSKRQGSDNKLTSPPSGASQASIKAAVQAAVAAGTDAGPRPHDGRGCFQCAARMQQRHALVDTTLTNTDIPGNDYKCVGIQKLGNLYQEGAATCESLCVSERPPHAGLCVAWSLKQRAQPPHTCCLKQAIGDQFPARGMVAGILATPFGGLANMALGFARPSEFRPAREWRRGEAELNPSARGSSGGNGAKQAGQQSPSLNENPYFAPSVMK